MYVNFTCVAFRHALYKTFTEIEYVFLMENFLLLCPSCVSISERQQDRKIVGFPYFRENPFSFSSKYFRFRPIFDENSTKITEYFRNFRGLENRKYRKFSIFSKFSSFEIAKIENNIFGIFNIFEIFEFRNFRNSKYRKWKIFLYFRNSSFQHITIFMVKNEYL